MTETRTLYVCHGMYGCETGCCVYRLCTDDEGDDEVGHFTFQHPGSLEIHAFAEREWPNIVKSDDVILEGKWYHCD